MVQAMVPPLYVIVSLYCSLEYTPSGVYQIVLGPDQNLVPIGVTKLYCDFQLDKYMRGLKMYDGLFRTVALKRGGGGGLGIKK